MESLSHLIYASAARKASSVEALKALLEQSRRRNAELAVTGMLLYVEGSFFQVIEGGTSAIDRLYADIEADGRHTGLTLIIRESIARRAFGDWSMGCVLATRDELASIPGLNDFFTAGSCLTSIDAGRASRLLAAFSAGRWRTRLAEFDETCAYGAHGR